MEEIGEGDCVFLYAGHGDLWKNSAWKSISAEQRPAAVAKFTARKRGFGGSTCEYMAEPKISFMERRPATRWHKPTMASGTSRTSTSSRCCRGVYECPLVWSPLKIVGAGFYSRRQGCDVT